MSKAQTGKKEQARKKRTRMNGEGSIYARRDSQGKVTGYQAALSIGYSQQGKPVRRFVSGKTQDEVRRKLDKLKSDRHLGRLTPSKHLTLLNLCERWLDQKVQKGDTKPNTIRSYRDTVKLYLKETIGKKKLETLGPSDVELMLTLLRDNGKTAQTQRYALSVLKMALNYALSIELVTRNVASGIKPPKVQRKEMRVLTQGEVIRFLEAARPHRLYVAFLLAVLTGMRRGEVLGLHWQDINFEAGYLTVTHNLVDHRGKVSLGTPKTEKSKRRIYLSPEVIIALHKHRQEQQVAAAQAGSAWQGRGFVCASELGGFTDPRNFERMFATVLKRSGVSKVRFHDLRHTAASLMILKGESPKVVSEMLGHTNVSFTLDRYTHVYNEQRKEAVLSLTDLTPEPEIDPTAASLQQRPKTAYLN